MDTIWSLMKLHKLANKLLPRRVVSQLRARFEFSESLWRRESYSYYGEDAVLAKLLNERTWKEAHNTGKSPNVRHDGFYVDVGCYMPIMGSNTHLLHKLGWNGLNIDACPESITMFNRARPGCSNVCSAVGMANGTIKFNSRAGSMNAIEMGGDALVPMLTLATLLDQYKVRKIDVLNIDVEGHNLSVLKSNDWNRWQPDFILVECDDTAVQRDLVIEEYMASRMYKMVGLCGLTTIYESQLA